MNVLVVLIHLIACIALIAIVLLQTGKGAEMGAAFGGASQTLFGGTGGSSFMSKLTTGAAVVFMITCLLLSYMYRPGYRGGRSVMTDIPVEQPREQPPVQQLPEVPEARPVQPETSGPAPTAPEASQKAAETPKQAPAETPKQPAAREQAKPQPDTKAKPPAAKEQPQQGQKK
ncbi:MAG: preprotein translocase subunit SecG [Syntrophobacteraceae bacterium]|jgi:preprotein translocase subunit SecG